MPSGHHFSVYQGPTGVQLYDAAVAAANTAAGHVPFGRTVLGSVAGGLGAYASTRWNALRQAVSDSWDALGAAAADRADSFFSKPFSRSTSAPSRYKVYHTTTPGHFKSSSDRYRRRAAMAYVLRSSYRRYRRPRRSRSRARNKRFRRF